jgi:hypothetical protein
MLLLLALALQAAAPDAPADLTYRIDPTTITLIGGMIATIIGTLVTGVISIITAMRVNTITAQQAATTSQLLTVAKDTEAIKGHVNSEKTASSGREATLQQENRLLREMLVDKTATAALLAQAAAGSRQIRATDALATPQLVEVVNTDAAPVPVAPVEPPLATVPR